MAEEETTVRIICSPTELLSKSRLEALSDGVFAIVMTLLVLELKVPEIENPGSHEILRAIAAEGTSFFSFAITFLLCTVFWSLQQSILNAARALQLSCVIQNVFVLMFVSFLPFTTGLVGHYIHSTVPLSIYFGNQLMIVILLGWALWEIRSTGLRVSGAVLDKLTTRIVALATASTFALLSASVWPTKSFTVFVVVLMLVRIITSSLGDDDEQEQTT